MGRPKKQTKPSQKLKPGLDDICLSRLHPSLRTKFIPLPKVGETLTDEQLAAIFSGDLSALREVTQLVAQHIPKKSDK